MNDKLELIIESALMRSSEPLSIQSLMNLFDTDKPTKVQIKSMIQQLLNIIPKNEDSSDALAIAISGQNIDYDYNFAYSDKNNGLDLAIARALLKEQNK